MLDNKKSKFEKLIFPDYDEGTFLNISSILICFFIFDKGLQNHFFELFTVFNAFNIFKLAIFYLLPISYIILSLIHAFSIKRKSFIEKKFLLTTTAILIYFIGYFFVTELENTIFVIFPIINCIHPFFAMNTLLVNDFQTVNYAINKIFVDREIGKLEAFMGIFMTTIVFLLSHFLLKNDFIITISICISYSTILNTLLTDHISIKIGSIITPKTKKNLDKYVDIILKNS